MTNPSPESRLIRAAVEHLRIAAAIPGPDDEKLHAIEAGIYLNTLKGIAFGFVDDPRACVAEAIKAAEIQFGRDCA